MDHVAMEHPVAGIVGDELEVGRLSDADQFTCCVAPKRYWAMRAPSCPVTQNVCPCM